MRVPDSVRARFLRYLATSGLVILILFSAELVILAVNWPFTREKTVQCLEQVSSSEVRVSDFHQTFFPHPGYDAVNIDISRSKTPGDPPIARIAKMSCRAGWASLLTFTHRIDRLTLESVQIDVPSHLPPPIRKYGNVKIPTTVTELTANGAVLNLAPRHEEGQIVHFAFPQLTLDNVGKNKAIRFRTLMQNSNPTGDIAASGNFGPLNPGKIGDTPVSGVYEFRHADLSQYKVIAGSLTARGSFKGVLGNIKVAGTSGVPNFEVTESRHSVALGAEYLVTVDGTKGDVILKWVRAHFLNTTLVARGCISGQHGKTVSLDFDAQRADIHDVLRLFVAADRPPLDGAMTFGAHVELPPVDEPFLKKLQLDGHFNISHAEFERTDTQAKVDELSARGRGDKNTLKSPSGPERVASDWRGNVRLRNQVAALSSAFFVVPGAVAYGSGTYQLATKAVDLRGKLAIRASLSKAATGFKSVLLTPFDPFFKKDGAGAVLRVQVLGTYSHPVFRVSKTP